MNKYIVLIALALAFTYSIVDIFVSIPSIVNIVIGIVSIPFAAYYGLFYFGGGSKLSELTQKLKNKLSSTDELN